MRVLAVALLSAVLLLFTLSPARGQRDLSGAAEIELRLEKLTVLGSVLMIAAHPDDENTALLAYLARGRHARTAYLSATRGEGGQNLIGPEQGDLMGVIRTQELLAARRIDGAEQFFTRAVDFGFTKTPEEALEKWGHERILSDMVWTIRHFRPDAIVLRFSGTPRDGHGQHQASAILGKEAYFAAADPSRFPEQKIEPWKPKRLLYNVIAFTPEQEDQAAATPGRIEIDTGVFNPILGKSYNEIAAISRSQHRSQGMGSAERRGPSKNYLTVIAGDPARGDLFDGIDVSWNRLPGGAAIGEILAEAARAFSPTDPAKTIPLLLKARPMIARLAGGPQKMWARIKLQELDEAIAACAGLWADVEADHPIAAPGGGFEATLSAIDRSAFPIKWLGPDTELRYNQVLTRAVPVPVPGDAAYTQPFWLVKPKTGSAYTIDRQDLRDLPDNPPYYTADFEFQAGPEKIELRRPLQYRYVDPAIGELVRPVSIAPPVAVNLAEPVFVFPNGKAQRVQAQVRANVAKASGEVRLAVEKGWTVEPAARPFHLDEIGEQADLNFEVTPSPDMKGASIRAIVKLGSQRIETGMHVISYSHIPVEITFPAPEARAEAFPVVTLAKKIGYVMGSGDDVPQALRQLGCEVTLLGPDDLAARNLSEFDAIVTGVRAYNLRSDLRANQSRILNYIQDGGTAIVQYNVPERGPFGPMGPAPRRVASETLAHIGPYPLKVGPARTTVEEAPVSFPDPDQLLITAPNKITERDFEGWVQERGLYFASEWDPRYQPVFESHDPGEKPQLGGTLYTRYGKGVYIFSSYVWFRQLPAGVPGAYRIFANMLSAAKVVSR
jgi:LmbE family N-acetylglucosaminyl deacetylase